MLLTWVWAESESEVMLENPKVARSAEPFGGPPNVQLVAVFQSPFTGTESQVAGPANTWARLSIIPSTAGPSQYRFMSLGQESSCS